MQTVLMIFWIFYLFMMGALFASFFNVVGIRSADNVSILRRSHCPKCDNELRWIDICPIFGYLINHGKCHFCKQPIHWKYLLIEIIGGLTFVLSFLVNGYIRYNLDFVFQHNEMVMLVMYLLLVSLMMMIVVSEYEHHVTLKKITYVFTPILFVLSISRFITDYKLALDSMLGMGVCILINLIFTLKDKSMFKYMLYVAAFGIVLGLFGSLLAIVVGFIIWLIVKLTKHNLGFVYYASIGAVISLFTNMYLLNLIIN